MSSSAKPAPGVATAEDNPDFLGHRSFSVSARVAMQLGRESISSSVTAILELVKNAYDADADQVRVRFARLGTPEALMVIEDDGKGMSPDQLMANWMVIGTGNKAEATKSAGKGRVMTGEKGLGRLGLDRLCKRTRLQSVSEGAAAVELFLDWTKYEQAESSRLEEIVHPLFRLPDLALDPITGVRVDYPKGTRLVLEGLRDSWAEPALSELYAELSLLVSPFRTQHDFRIWFDTGGGFPKFDGAVEPNAAVLDHAYWRVVATIDSNMLVEMRMSSGLRETEFHQRPVPWTEFAKNEGSVPMCGSLRFEFYFFSRGELNPSAEAFKLPQLNQFLKNNQGVRIYRDGFRVKPYGDPNGDGDWLKLGYRRTSSPEGVGRKVGSWKLGYNQVVGAVFLGREDNQALIDQTNREGLVTGEAFRHLRIFAEKTLEFFERNHQKFWQSRLPDSDGVGEDRISKARESVKGADAALRELDELARTLNLAPQPSGAPSAQSSLEGAKASVAVVKQTLAGMKALQEMVTQMEREKDTLANLASLGILAACFGHETIGWTDSVIANSGWLERNLKTYFFMTSPTVEAQVAQILTDIGTDSRKLQTFAAFALGNVRPDKRRQRVFCVKKLATEVFAAFGDSLQKQKEIQVDLRDVPPNECLIRAYVIDWESIFANLITNAMWALVKCPVPRMVRLSIVEDAASLTIKFEDSGFGLEAGTEERVFDPGFSTKRNHKGETEGTGMGLYIVRSFVVENSGGTVRAVCKGDLGGACFTMVVPRARPEKDE